MMRIGASSNLSSDASAPADAPRGEFSPREATGGRQNSPMIELIAANAAICRWMTGHQACHPILPTQCLKIIMTTEEVNGDELPGIRGKEVVRIVMTLFDQEYLFAWPISPGFYRSGGITVSRH